MEAQADLPVLGIRKRVLFPSVLLRLTIGRPKSVALVESLWDPVKQTFKKGARVMICAVCTNEEDIPEGEEEEDNLETVQYDEEVEVFRVGTVAKVLHLSRVKGSRSGNGAKFSMLVEGVSRASVIGPIVEKSERFSTSGPFPSAATALLPVYSREQDTEIRALALNVKRAVGDLLEAQRGRRLSTKAAQAFDKLKQTIEEAAPDRLVDVLASNLDASLREKQQILEDTSLASRLESTLQLVTRQHQVLSLSQQIQDQVENRMKTTQREYLLRQQLKAIKQELQTLSSRGSSQSDAQEASEEDDEEDDSGLAGLERALERADMPPAVAAAAKREMKRLQQLQPSQPEYSVLRSYLECLAEIPWSVSTRDNLDVRHAREVLDNDHFGLDKVKRRVVEFLAVRALSRDMRGPILCLVGPPGVGKTSLGRSIASSLGRKYRRIALGGVRDEAEVRGHRRTYIGAMPGNVVQAIRKAGVNNPVIVLDEIDKLGQDVRGDPGAALLEVLDPEQNDSFTDHYLNVPLDLSKVLFLATANSLETIPAPLRDRMEVIQVPGYTSAEKLQIAARHLLPKQLERHGISGDFMEITPEAWSYLLDGYTREAGVRNLDRHVAAICRHVAVRVAEEAASRGLTTGGPNAPGEMEEGNGVAAGSTLGEIGEGKGVAAGSALGEMEEGNGLAAGSGAEEGSQEEPPSVLDQMKEGFKPIVVTKGLVVEILGPHLYESEIALRTSVPGVATGMAWTQVGGEILFVEASVHRGTGRLQLTGQLGKVMSESVRAALSFVRAHLDELGLFQDRHGRFVDIEQELDALDIHVHFPAGAVPKDGPSAGVAVCAALVSALSGRCVRSDTACTGEITLRGLVLPVGGIKEKVLAAHRAGLRRVVLPERNEKDLLEIPAAVREDLEVVLVGDILAAVNHLVPRRPGRPVAGEDEAESWHDKFRARNARRGKIQISQSPGEEEEDEKHGERTHHTGLAPRRPVVRSKV